MPQPSSDAVGQFREGQTNRDSEVRAYLVGELMREAKPDGVSPSVLGKTASYGRGSRGICGVRANSGRGWRIRWPRQRRILGVLAGITRRGPLTGGGALLGVQHGPLGHRETRDLDLFWRTCSEPGTLVADSLTALLAAGLDARVLRTNLRLDVTK